MELNFKTPNNQIIYDNNYYQVNKIEIQTQINSQKDSNSISNISMAGQE